MIIEHSVSWGVRDYPNPGGSTQGQFCPQPGNIFGCHDWKACYWQSDWWRHNPTMHRMAPFHPLQRMPWPQISLVQKLRTPALGTPLWEAAAQGQAHICPFPAVPRVQCRAWHTGGTQYILQVERVTVLI